MGLFANDVTHDKEGVNIGKIVKKLSKNKRSWVPYTQWAKLKCFVHLLPLVIKKIFQIAKKISK